MSRRVKRRRAPRRETFAQEMRRLTRFFVDHSPEPDAREVLLSEIRDALEGPEQPPEIVGHYPGGTEQLRTTASIYQHVIEHHGRDRTDPLFQESCLEMVRGFLDEMLPRGEDPR